MKPDPSGRYVRPPAWCVGGIRVPLLLANRKFYRFGPGQVNSWNYTLNGKNYHLKSHLLVGERVDADGSDKKSVVNSVMRMGMRVVDYLYHLFLSFKVFTIGNTRHHTDPVALPETIWNANNSLLPYKKIQYSRVSVCVI